MATNERGRERLSRKAEKEEHRADVAVFLFSEFGRRVKENGSQGTDHGAAAPLFVLGDKVRGGVQGGVPDLADLDDGDVRYRIDFRDVYASLLADWLAVDPTPVLGPRKAGLNLLVGAMRPAIVNDRCMHPHWARGRTMGATHAGARMPCCPAPFRTLAVVSLVGSLFRAGQRHFWPPRLRSGTSRP